jgi:hypothetical protein
MKASLTIQPEWVRVMITETPAKRLNLTTSYGGETISGRGVETPQLKKALNKFIGRINGTRKIGDAMAEVHGLALKSNTIEEFVNAL